VSHGESPSPSFLCRQSVEWLSLVIRNVGKAVANSAAEETKQRERLSLRMCGSGVETMKTGPEVLGMLYAGITKEL
jgi:hypothetical protein